MWATMLRTDFKVGWGNNRITKFGNFLKNSRISGLDDPQFDESAARKWLRAHPVLEIENKLSRHEEEDALFDLSDLILDRLLQETFGCTTPQIIEYFRDTPLVHISFGRLTIKLICPETDIRDNIITLVEKQHLTLFRRGDTYRCFGYYTFPFVGDYAAYCYIEDGFNGVLTQLTCADFCQMRHTDAVLNSELREKDFNINKKVTQYVLLTEDIVVVKTGELMLPLDFNLESLLDFHRREPMIKLLDRYKLKLDKKVVEVDFKNYDHNDRDYYLLILLNDKVTLVKLSINIRTDNFLHEYFRVVQFHRKILPCRLFIDLIFMFMTVPPVTYPQLNPPKKAIKVFDDYGSNQISPSYVQKGDSYFVGETQPLRDMTQVKDKLIQRFQKGKVEPDVFIYQPVFWVEKGKYTTNPTYY